jgi:uncharacterized membrane protein (DUF106 family)
MQKSLTIMFVVLIVSALFGLMWDQIPIIKESVHAILDPTFGALLVWNVTVGMLLISALLALITTLMQKYFTDQDTLRKLKAEQKLLQQEMRKFEKDPQKLLQLQKKQLEFIPKTMDLTMRPLIFTAVPIILLFRWFNDFFLTYSADKIFGFMTWIWAYLLFSIIFSAIFRKVLNVA